MNSNQLIEIKHLRLSFKIKIKFFRRNSSQPIEIKPLRPSFKFIEIHSKEVKHLKHSENSNSEISNLWEKITSTSSTCCLLLTTKKELFLIENKPLRPFFKIKFIAIN